MKNSAQKLKAFLFSSLITFFILTVIFYSLVAMMWYGNQNSWVLNKVLYFLVFLPLIFSIGSIYLIGSLEILWANIFSGLAVSVFGIGVLFNLNKDYIFVLMMLFIAISFFLCIIGFLSQVNKKVYQLFYS